MQFYLETILKKFYFQNTNEIEIGGITFFIKIIIISWIFVNFLDIR